MRMIVMVTDTLVVEMRQQIAMIPIQMSMLMQKRFGTMGLMTTVILTTITIKTLMDNSLAITAVLTVMIPIL